MRSSKYNSPAYVTHVKYLRSVLCNPEINYAVVTRTRQCILSWPSWIQCTSCFFQATSVFLCHMRLCLTSLRAQISHLIHVCYMFQASHFPGFITLIILVKVGYELRILLRNLSLRWGLKVNNSLWWVTILPLGSPVVGSAPFRPNGRRRLGINGFEETVRRGWNRSVKAWWWWWCLRNLRFRKSSCALLKSLLGLLDPFVEGTNHPSKRRALFAQLHGVISQNTFISMKLRSMKLSYSSKYIPFSVKYPHHSCEFRARYYAGKCREWYSYNWNFRVTEIRSADENKSI
jgi:hypothetical protein